mgnify:CR=1 FL=1
MSRMLVVIVMTSVFLLASPNCLFSQEDPINFSLAKSHWKKAFKEGKDFCMGVSVYNFRIQKNKNNAVIKDYLPNATSIFGGYSHIRAYKERSYSAFEFLLGKRKYTAKDHGEDELNLFTASKFTDYFLSVPLRYGYSIPVGQNSFLGLETGPYMLWSLGGEISNSNGTRELHYAFDDSQEIRMLDVGWANKVTYSYRALYAQVGFDFGLRNFAPRNADYLLKNQANYSFIIGYRFGSKLHKEDMNKLNKISGGLVGDDPREDNKNNGTQKRKAGDILKKQNKNTADDEEKDDNENKNNSKRSWKRKTVKPGQ